MKKTLFILIMFLGLANQGCAARQLVKPIDVQAEKKIEAVKNVGPVVVIPKSRQDILQPIVSSISISINVYFSPYDDCEKPWIDTIMKASSYVYVSCYGITNTNITQALINRKKAGCNVIVCTDKMSAAGKSEKLRQVELEAAGIPYIIKKTQVLEHNKMVAVDDRYAITGSWNLSGNAQAQDNNIEVFDWPAIAIQARYAIERIYNRDK